MEGRDAKMKFSRGSLEPPSTSQSFHSQEEEIYDSYWTQNDGRYGTVNQRSPLEPPGEYDLHYRPDARPLEQEKARPSSDRDLPHPEPPNYRPSALKWWFLTILVALLVVCMALTAYAARVLPAESSHDLFVGPPPKAANGSGAVIQRSFEVDGPLALVEAVPSPHLRV